MELNMCGYNWSIRHNHKGTERKIKSKIRYDD